MYNSFTIRPADIGYCQMVRYPWGQIDYLPTSDQCCWVRLGEVLRKIQLISLEISKARYEQPDIDTSVLRLQLLEEALTTEELELLRLAAIDINDIELVSHPCTSKPVYCFLVSEGSVVVGTNSINKPMPTCHRFIHKIDPYDYCADEDGCFQPAHGEIMAVIKLFMQMGLLDNGHLAKLLPGTQFNEKGQVTRYGIIRHDLVIDTLRQNHNLRLPTDTQVFIWGVRTCCERCAEILLHLGIHQIFTCPATEDWNYKLRTTLHQEAIYVIQRQAGSSSEES